MSFHNLESVESGDSQNVGSSHENYYISELHRVGILTSVVHKIPLFNGVESLLVKTSSKYEIR